ncbi:MAG: DUF4190 domain-containing protein, partial [Anaerolineae bacterium]|nr:DUF4190 domain-containing protein [Anaerolineae bacterium]
MSDRNFTPQPENNTLAIVSLVSGIAGWSVVPFFGAVVAIITGHMAKREIRESNQEVGGGGLALAGLILGYGCLGAALLVACGAIIIFSF